MRCASGRHCPVLSGLERPPLPFDQAPANVLVPGLETAAYHGVDILFVFGTDGGAFGSGAPSALSEAMMGYWTRFASTGDPNSAVDQAPFWPAYAASSDEHLLLATPIGTGSGLRSTECTFWDRVYAEVRAPGG